MFKPFHAKSVVVIRGAISIRDLLPQPKAPARCDTHDDSRRDDARDSDLSANIVDNMWVEILDSLAERRGVLIEQGLIVGLLEGET